jgi:beta-glucosidase
MNADQTPAARASELMNALTLEQKLSLVHQALGEFTAFGAAGYVPGIPALCIPPLVLNDAGSGLADLQVGITSYPAEIDQAATWDPGLEHELGTSLGAEAHAKGVDDLLAPDLNLTRTPLGGRTSEEMGEDPYLTWQMGDAFIEGVQSQHVIATAKQYVGNDQEVDRASINEVISPRALKELYEAPFASAISQANVGSVMCAYNKVNGAFNCENPNLIFDNLEGTDGFQGFIVSDWGATHSTVASADAGLDLEMGIVQIPNAVEPLTGPSLPPGSEELAEDWFGTPLAEAVADGQVSMNVLNNTVSRILHSMFADGVFDDPPTPLPAGTLHNVDTPANRAVALSVAESGSVLLQDNDGVLPISGTGKQIAIIGLDAGVGAALASQAGGSVRTAVPDVVTPLSAITTRAAQAGDSVVYNSGASPALAAAAAWTASVAIVYAGYTEGEGSDLPNLDYTNGLCELTCVTLPSNANAVISAVAAANPHTVVVLNTGGPALMPWLDQVQGVLEAWYPGEEDGTAAAAILFGDVDPSGKLPVTFPSSLAQTPTQTAAQYPGINGVMTYSEGLLIGYRWYDAKGLTPLFPFGYGLSYTTFGFSGLSLSPSSGGVHVAATLTNTGLRSGSDVVQVYVSDPPSTGEPPQQLEAFAKETVAPGGSATVSLALAPHAFSYWDTADGQWTEAPGCYTIRVGDSSAHVPLTGTVALAGGHCV